MWYVYATIWCALGILSLIILWPYADEGYSISNIVSVAVFGGLVFIIAVAMHIRESEFINMLRDAFGVIKDWLTTPIIKHRK